MYVVSSAKYPTILFYTYFKLKNSNSIGTLSHLPAQLKAKYT